MIFGRMIHRRGRVSTTSIEEVSSEEEAPLCTFDDDADPSIERCWADHEPDNVVKNATASRVITINAAPSSSSAEQPLVVGMTGVALICVVVVVMMLLKEQKAKRGEQQDPSPAGNVQLPGVPQPEAGPSEEASSKSRVKELELCLEREAKEKQGLSEQNNFLKSALEERKATVQMFTSELQSRDEQLANFEQDQMKVKNELYNQIGALKRELQAQEKLQQQNLNNMDGQCAHLAGKVEGLMKELAKREEQWETFEIEAKAKEIDSAVQIAAIKREYATREQTQKASMNAKDKECADLTAKLETLAQEKNASEAQLHCFGRQREKWTAATSEMKRLLKEKREEIVGLTTRMELFMGELKAREARVEALEQKRVDKNELTATNLRDLQKVYHEQMADHEVWKTRTAEISRMLEEREAESRDVAAKLESITKQFNIASENATELEAKVQNREFVMSSNKVKLDKALEDEQTQCVHWVLQYTNILRLLQERQEECVSLTARVEIFAAELESREKIVVNLEGKVQDKKNLVVSQLQATENDLKGSQAFRDTWSSSTKGIYNMLEEKREQLVGLSTRVDLFQLELKKREERVAKLGAVLKGKKDISSAALEPRQTQLEIHQLDLDEWTNNTNDIKQLLKAREGECVGLTTRLNLFKQKVAEYEANVTRISEKVNEKEGSQTLDLSPLRGELQKQQAEREKWNRQTIEIVKLLKDRQGQCAGLTIRVTLFQRQTKMIQEQMGTLAAKLADREETFKLKITPLRKELHVQREGLEAWKKSSKNVEMLLERAEQECDGLTAALRSHVVKLQGCQKEVARLQAQVIVGENLIVSVEEHHIAHRNVEEEELENWSNKTRDLEHLWKTKEGQIAGLATRVSLFNAELAKRQTALADLETKFKERGSAFDSHISSLRNELKFQEEQRDHCLQATLSMNKSMKEAKEPCVGLTTRLALFQKELAGREERVKVLTTQVQEKEELVRSELTPIRHQLQKQREDRDDWNESTVVIFQMLKSRREAIAGTTTRLELFMSELQKKEDAVDATEMKFKEVEKGLAQIDDLESEIRAQEEQRLKWQESTAETARLLQLKQEHLKNPDKRTKQDCVSLSAKLDLFEGELQRREEKVLELKATAKYKSEVLSIEREELVKAIPVLRKHRDSWMEKTLAINQSLKDIQTECLGLSTRWNLFDEELNKKRDAVTFLESRLKEKEEHHAQMVVPYKNELKVQLDLVAKWVETTDKMARLLTMKENDCVLFTTQLETAIDELSSRKENVVRLEARLREALDLSELEMTSLQKQLAGARERLATWKASTEIVEKSFKDTQQECANLKVRLQVFHRQVETQNGRIATLESSNQARNDEFNAQMIALKDQLRELQIARDEAVRNTLTIIQQIQEKEMQRTSISSRLSLFRSELEKRATAVASLDAKLQDAEGMSASQLDPMKKQLQQQRDELAEWAQNTKEVEQLLKKRDAERVGLATRMQLFQLQLKRIEESVSTLEEQVKDREEAAAYEIAPLKNALETQQGERDRWTKSTMEIVNLLKDRKNQISGLTVRLTLFRKEVKHRQQEVKKIASQLHEKQVDLNAVNIGSIKKELTAVTQERDEWATVTKKLTKILNDKRSECDGLTTRLQCFKIELQKREEACNVLLNKYEGQKSLYGSQVQVLQSELAMQMEQRDKWRETTAEMSKQLEDRQMQCTGLTTRVELFRREIKGHDTTIASLKSKVEENDAAIAAVEDFKKELKVQQNNCDSLSKAMEETDQLLKVKKEQCVGLATRLVVFGQQVEGRIERLYATESRIKEKEELSNAQIESLRIDLQSQKEQLDKWSETTEELKKLLEEKEEQSSIISAELELLTTLQTGNG